MTADIMPTQEQILAIATVFHEVENDPTARGSAIIMTRKILRALKACSPTTTSTSDRTDLIARIDMRLEQIRQNGGSYYNYGIRDQELDREILKVLPPVAEWAELGDRLRTTAIEIMVNKGNHRGAEAMQRAEELMFIVADVLDPKGKYGNSTFTSTDSRVHLGGDDAQAVRVLKPDWSPRAEATYDFLTGIQEELDQRLQAAAGERAQFSLVVWVDGGVVYICGTGQDDLRTADELADIARSLSTTTDKPS